MATTRRIAAQKRRKFKITPKAVDLFKQMHELPKCSCVWGPEYWDRRFECQSCKDWWTLHGKLHTALGLSMVGQYPVFNGGPAKWDTGGEVFNALMTAAYGEQQTTA